MAAMKKIQGQSTSHPCAIAQWAAVEALNGPQDVLETMLSTFTRRRKQTLDALNATEGINCVSPDGAFYIFASVEAHLGCRAPNGTVMQEDSDWVLALMEDQGVAVVPGSAFGAPGYFRLSFAAADDLLAEATRRIRNFVERLD
jgi:aspartate aminotransferase